MKKILVLITVTMLLMVACGNSEMSLEEVESAIEDGILTVEEAYEQGLVDDEWVDDYYEKREEGSIEASNKLNSNIFNDFTTTTLDGKEFNQTNLEGVTYIAFIDPSTAEGKNAYEVIESSYTEINNMSANVVYITKSSDENEMFNNTNFSVIYYNDSIDSALDMYSDLANAGNFSGVCAVDNAFVSSWNTKIDKESLISTIEAIINLAK